MNPGRFYMPGYMGMRNLPMSSSMLGMANTAPRSAGLFSRITSGIRSINWGGLLNNANKTLNVVNQAIPLVRQAGPMFSNMRSMLRIAKAFGSETNGINNINARNNVRNVNNNVNNNRNNSVQSNENVSTKKEEVDDNSLSFFV